MRLSALVSVIIVLARGCSAQGAVQLFSDSNCANANGNPIPLLAETCLGVNQAGGIAIVSLPSCPAGKKATLEISDLDECQKPSFYPPVASGGVGKCLYFSTGSAIGSVWFFCADDPPSTSAASQPVNPPSSQSVSQLTNQPATLTTTPTTPPSPKVSSSAAVPLQTTDGPLDPTSTAQSQSPSNPGQPTQISSGISLADRIALGCGIGIGIPALILAYLNLVKKHPEPPPPYEP